MVVYSAAAAAMVRVFGGHTALLWAVHWDVEQDLGLIAAVDGTLAVWHLTTGTLSRCCRAPEAREILQQCVPLLPVPRLLPLTHVHSSGTPNMLATPRRLPLPPALHHRPKQVLHCVHWGPREGGAVPCPGPGPAVSVDLWGPPYPLLPCVFMFLPGLVLPSRLPGHRGPHPLPAASHCAGPYPRGRACGCRGTAGPQPSSKGGRGGRQPFHGRQSKASVVLPGLVTREAQQWRAALRGAGRLECLCPQRPF